MVPVRVSRAFRLPIIAVTAALALSGCMRTATPVAVVAQPADLDSFAYGPPISAPAQVVAASSGGAISAHRTAFASSPRPGVYAAPVPVAYAAAAPVRYDAAYHLDAGDRLRVVVYGQE